MNYNELLLVQNRHRELYPDNIYDTIDQILTHLLDKEEQPKSSDKQYNSTFE